MKRKITIVSDGTAPGTKIIDADGKEMDMGSITSVEWRVDAKTGVGMAKVEFINVAVQLVGQADG